MANFPGIKFSSLYTVFQHFAQLFVVSYMVISFFFFGPLGLILFVYLLFSEYCYLALLYGAWLWYDRDTCEIGGRRVSWLKSGHFWGKVNEYFPLDLTKTADLNPQRNYIFACHPHGVCVFGAYGNFGNNGSDFFKLYPGIRITGLTLKMHFMWPFARDILLALGACAATRKSIAYLLRKQGTGNGLVLVPGGSAEAYESHPRTAVLVLKKRKGFVKLAIENGADLVPVYTFGETDVYHSISNPEGSIIRKIQTKFKDIFGFPLFLINGRGIFQSKFGLLPHRRTMHTIVGSPIVVEKLDNPSQEAIDKYHTMYLESLCKLFDEHKLKLGDSFKNQVLVIK